MEINCRFFNGYKPCGKSDICSSACPQRDSPQVSVLIIHLGALGAVLRATSLLPAVKRKYPSSRITWVTDAPAHQLLAHNPYLDRILTSKEEDLLALSNLEFDVAYVVDKSLKASGILKRTHTDLLFGFRVDPRSGSIIPANSEAEELWQLGLDNQRKFFVNKKPETQLMCEALALDYQRDSYVLNLTEEEKRQVNKKRKAWSQNDQAPVIGINTGCSHVIPFKKLTVDTHIELIQKLQWNTRANIVLLGGPEDTERNQEIGKATKVIVSPTSLGLREGLTSVGAVDLVITGDSLGMHMAIALKKYTIAWFGPTCSHEIDLYDQGESILSSAACSPCWKRNCNKDIMCYDLVDIDKIVETTLQFLCLPNESTLVQI